MGTAVVKFQKSTFPLRPAVEGIQVNRSLFGCSGGWCPVVFQSLAGLSIPMVMIWEPLYSISFLSRVASFWSSLVFSLVFIVKNIWLLFSIRCIYLLIRYLLGEIFKEFWIGIKTGIQKGLHETHLCRHTSRNKCVCMPITCMDGWAHLTNE